MEEMRTKILSEGLKERNWVQDLAVRQNNSFFVSSSTNLHYMCKLLRLQISTNHYDYNKISDDPKNYF
jgi:hypothetical protein